VLVGEKGVAVGEDELTRVLGTKGVLVGVGRGVRVGTGMGVGVGTAKMVDVRKGTRVGGTTRVAVGLDTSRAVGGTTRVAVGVGIRVAVGATNWEGVAAGKEPRVVVDTGTLVAWAPSPPAQAKPTAIIRAAMPAAAILNLDLLLPGPNSAVSWRPSRECSWLCRKPKSEMGVFLGLVLHILWLIIAL